MRDAVMRMTAALVGLALLGAGGLEPAAAQYFRRPISHLDPNIMRIDETAVLGAKIEGATPLVDQRGEIFHLADILGKPLILVLAYYTCDGSCSLINAALNELLGDVRLVRPGADFRILTLSFDRRDNLETTDAFHKHLDLVGALAQHWTFATFQSVADLERETTRIGFKFFWSPEDRLFLHPGAFLFFSPEGRLVRVLYHPDVNARDVELAVLDAKAGQFRPSEIVNFALSLCYSYSYQDGKYILSIPVVVGVGSLFTGVSILLVSIFFYNMRSRGAPMGKKNHAQIV